MNDLAVSNDVDSTDITDSYPCLRTLAEHDIGHRAEE